MTKNSRSKPGPQPRQRWRFDGREAEVIRILPGGANDLGIVEFDGSIPSAHVNTMLRFDAWAFVSHPPQPHLPAIDVGDGPPVGVCA